VHLHLALSNSLSPNHYHVGFSMTTGSGRTNLVAWAPEAVGLIVFGGDDYHGLVALEHTLDIEREAASASAPGAHSAPLGACGPGRAGPGRAGPMSVAERQASSSAEGDAPLAAEIAGPSAFGGSARRFVRLTWTIAVTDFRVTYFGSALGYLWSLIRPLLSFAVLFVVFSSALRLGGGIRYYPLLLLMNIVLMQFFQEATGDSVTGVLAREALVRKMHFPRLVLPLAVVLTSAFNFGLNLLALFAFLLVYGITPTLGWLGIPLLVGMLVLLTSGVAMLLSALYVRFRDVGQIWGLTSQILFYGSLVFFTIERVHSIDLRRLVLLNPIAAILQQARHWIIDPGAPSLASAMGGGAGAGAAGTRRGYLHPGPCGVQPRGAEDRRAAVAVGRASGRHACRSAARARSRRSAANSALAVESCPATADSAPCWRRVRSSTSSCSSTTRRKRSTRLRSRRSSSGLSAHGASRAATRSAQEASCDHSTPRPKTAGTPAKRRSS